VDGWLYVKGQREVLHQRSAELDSREVGAVVKDVFCNVRSNAAQQQLNTDIQVRLVGWLRRGHL